MTVSEPAFRADDQQHFAPITVAAPPPRPIREPLTVDMLLVDDDPERQRSLSAALSTVGHEVSAAASVAGALRLLHDEAFEVIVLSSSESDRSLLDATREVRAVSDAPLIVLGPDAGTALQDAVIDAGADDYLVAPVIPSDIDRLARARARRASQRRRTAQLTGPANITMHVRAHEVLVRDDRLQLTPKEFAILRLLLERRGEVVATDEISLTVWGHETYGSRNFVEAHISRLRQKLSRYDAGSVISTVRGIGYVIR